MVARDYEITTATFPLFHRVNWALPPRRIDLGLEHVLVILYPQGIRSILSWGGGGGGGEGGIRSMLSPIHNCIPAQMIFCLSLPAAVATGVEDKSGVSPVRTLPTRSRAQALNMRGCVSVCESVCVSVCLGGGGHLQCAVLYP